MGNVDERSLTYGEQAVGLNFNPDENPKVKKLKKLYAEIIDFVHGNEIEQDRGKLGEKLDNLAYDQAILSQMAAVKAVTYHKSVE